MTEPSATPPVPGKLSARTTMFLVGLLIAYALLHPSLEGWFGIDLPSLTEHQGEVTEESEGRPPAGKSNARPTSREARHEPDAREATGSPKFESASGDLGQLRETSGRVFVSTAGLRYRPGSQEGHRIDHVLRHGQDDPSRPVHGVFDGDRDEILAVIDEAYLSTQERGPPDATIEREDGRSVWTVDLGRRIGYVGGQSGRRKNHPAAHHLNLVLENGTNVVSAYPVRVSDR